MIACFDLLRLAFMKILPKVLLVLTLLAVFSIFRIDTQPVHGESSSGSILFDETLNEYGESRITTGYADLAQQLRDAGYLVEALTMGPIAYDKLSQYSALAITAPFTPPKSLAAREITDVKRFVSQGGGLLLAAVGWSWVTYAKLDVASDPANEIGAEFGITVNNDIIRDPTDNDGGPARPLFRKFASHPVTNGLSQVSVDTPSSLSVQAGAYAVVSGDDDSYSQSDATFTYPRGSHPPFVAVAEFDNGRVVYLGHDGIFHDRNIGKFDNSRLALNIFNWLVQPRRTATVTLIHTITEVTTQVQSVVSLPMIAATGVLVAFAFSAGYLLASRRKGKVAVDEDTKIW